METAIMKVKDIHPAAYNPRVTLKPGDDEWEALNSSLDRFGLVEPLVINKTTGLLVSGHQRLNVLKTQGVDEVEVVIIEVDPEQEKLLNIALNKIDSEWDYEKLKDLFDEIDEDDVKFTGFTAEELDSLFNTDFTSDDDDGDPAGQEDTDDSEKPEPKEKPEGVKEFNIFVSFPSKEIAEKWLKDRGVDVTYEGAARNITIRMEGINYGTGN